VVGDFGNFPVVTVVGDKDVGTLDCAVEIVGVQVNDETGELLVSEGDGVPIVLVFVGTPVGVANMLGDKVDNFVGAMG